MAKTTRSVSRAPVRKGPASPRITMARLPIGPGRVYGHASRRPVPLDRLSDGAEDLADLAAEEDEGHDREDRDQGEDQRVLREALTLIVMMKPRVDRTHERHGSDSLADPLDDCGPDTWGQRRVCTTAWSRANGPSVLPDASPADESLN